MAELVTIKTWLKSLLDGNAVGVADRVYDAPAPPLASFPLVTFQYLDGADVRGVGPARIMTDGLWLIRAINKSNDYGTISGIANSIDTLLQGSPGSGSVLGSVRERPFELTEEVDSVKYIHLGGVYRIYAQ